MALPILGTELGYLLLPFFLIFAIVYGALEFADIFKNRTVKFIIAAVIGIFSVGSSEGVGLIYSIMPYAAILFVVFFFLGFLVKIFRGKKEGEQKSKADYTLLMACIALALIFLAAGGENFGLSLDKDAIALIVLAFILLLLLIAYKQPAQK